MNWWLTPNTPVQAIGFFDEHHPCRHREDRSTDVTGARVKTGVGTSRTAPFRFSAPAPGACAAKIGQQRRSLHVDLVQPEAQLLGSKERAFVGAGHGVHPVHRAGTLPNLPSAPPDA